MLEKGWYWSWDLLAEGRKQRKVFLSGWCTHAVQAPCILQLIPSPQSRETGRFFLSKVGGQFFRNRLSGQQGAVEIESNDSVHSHCVLVHSLLFLLLVTTAIA